LKSQKGAGHFMGPICLLQQVLGGKFVAPNHGVDDPETEIWRACRRSSTTRLLVMSVPNAVYIVHRSCRILTSVVLRSQGQDGVKCQANTLRLRRR
jgi:hypothetical protein